MKNGVAAGGKIAAAKASGAKAGHQRGCEGGIKLYGSKMARWRGWRYKNAGGE